MPNKGLKVSQFAPEFLEAFKAGARKEITIRFPTENQAATFVSRMNRLRQAMRREGHYMTEIAEGVTVSNYPDKKVVRVRPVDMQFLDAVKSALMEQSDELDYSGSQADPSRGEANLPLSEAERAAYARAGAEAEFAGRDSDVSPEASSRRGDFGNNSGGVGKGSREAEQEKFAEKEISSEEAMKEFMKGNGNDEV